ncbi:mechanosensitive ion channel family protein [Shewanella yunxiaonensis]|uniref:Small-conductance mechanosensitive channel n=1 Tax=Shewanella yunxiaonensis TaxID=2829809 RepID=A0ABX7YUL1_9GAMM|nr:MULTISPECIES: mechanosensitive ion channel family protein [Shewanella]MDF0535159.1 mechanosensitive ion channel family protein [Shewanella sp. A32]QUN06173.1 mechanosensitive ion channel family protein [Shewanella yunxiaonensis]
MADSGLGSELAQIQQVYDVITEYLVKYSFQILGALIIFLLGLWLAGKASTMVEKQLQKHNIDVTLSTFVTHLVRLLVIIMVGIIALGKLGISVTPMVAAIGAASLGAGLAVQGMLSNYAAGITIIVSRPFVVGNTISINNITGQVKDIKLGMTFLTNEEGELISIPNKHILGEVLHNSFANKLVELHFNIDYQTDPTKVIELINGILESHPQVDKQCPLQVGINGFNSTGLDIGVRYWIPTASYFQDKYQVNLQLWQALVDAGISIPRPAQQLYIHQ